VTLHGDLHTANVIVDDTGPVFIDLDSLAAGDPAYDIALLGSRLLLSALSRGDDIGQALTLIASLPDWYGEAGGTSISNRVYTWYIAALLLGRQVKTCIRHSAPSTSRIAPTLLEVARATLERGRIAAA
jgi:aminoglycoside phosphotransferase (APT) family kinase protein